MIGQYDQIQGHIHATPQYFEYAYGADTSTGGREQNFTGRYANTGDPLSDGMNGTPRYGTETRSVNFTFKVWKRIN